MCHLSCLIIYVYLIVILNKISLITLNLALHVQSKKDIDYLGRYKISYYILLMLSLCCVVPATILTLADCQFGPDLIVYTHEQVVMRFNVSNR